MSEEIRYRCSNYAVAKGRLDPRRLEPSTLFKEALEPLTWSDLMVIALQNEIPSAGERYVHSAGIRIAHSSVSYKREESASFKPRN